MNVFRVAVTACALAGAGLVLAAVPATSALASTGTTVGQTGTPMSSVRLIGRFEDVQADAAMPAGGLVTSFQTQSSSCSAVQGVYDFQVLRPLGGNQYQVLGDTGNQTDPCDSQLHSYPVSIPVQAGDVIGVYVVSSWQGCSTSLAAGKPRGFRSRRWETPSRWSNHPGRSTSPRRW